MAKNLDGDSREALPACAVEYIRLVKKKMRYRRRARAEVGAELTGHFEDALRDCTDAEQRDAKARALIEQFGDARLLAVLCRRAKKRCRPLWQKVLARSLGGVGIVVLYFLLCLGRFFVGTPSVKVDYVAWFSEQVKQGRDESLNAKPYVDEAAKLAGKEPYVYQLLGDDHARWPGDMNDVQRQAVAKLLEKDAAAFDALGEGVTKPYYWTDYRPRAAGRAEPSPNGSISSGSPGTSVRGGSALMAGNLLIPGAYDAVSATLPNYRRLVRGLALRARWRAWQGDTTGACADSLSLQRVGWHLEGQGLVMEQLVGVAIEAMAHDTILTILDRAEVPANLLQCMQEEIQGQVRKQETVITLTSERIFWYDYIQRTFTDDGKGDGRPLRGALPLVAGGWRDGLRGVVTFSCPGRRETMRIVDAFYDEIELMLKEMPWQAGQSDKADRLRAVVADSFLLGLMADSQARLAHQVWRVKAGRAALVTTLAVWRYKKDDGAYPDGLDALIAEGYLGEMPIDPYSGQPFSYRKTADGFLLYSWGENLTDDGGRRSTGRDGKPRQWAPNGDWVFWPVMRSTD
jgi:hypothetical protein